MPGPENSWKSTTGHRETYSGGYDTDRNRNRADRRTKALHTESDKLRKLFYSSMRAYEKKPMDRTTNPVWQNYPERCQHAIKSAEQLRMLLDYYSHSDEVMVVRYHRDGCVSCNALDKVMEHQCRTFKRHVPGLHFFDLNAGDDPVMVDGMRRFPQLKAFNAGNWQDIEFKPPQDFRESVLHSVQLEVEDRAAKNEPVTALQAEEMYFSVAAPAMSQTIEDGLWSYYNAARVRIHNYWKQVSVRRTWYFNKYIKPGVDEASSKAMADASIFGEMKQSHMEEAAEMERIALERQEKEAAYMAAQKKPMQH